MGIHIFVAAGRGENLLRIQFMAFKFFLRLCRDKQLLRDSPPISVWKGPPMKAMGGEYIGEIHALDVDALQMLLKSKKIDYNQFIYLDKQYSIGFESLLYLSGPNGTTLEVPCNFYMETALKDLYGDVSLEVFKHFNRDFNDYFVGSEEWIQENQVKLQYILKKLAEHAAVRRIDVGNDPGVTSNMLEAIFIYRKDRKAFYRDLLTLPKELLARRDETIPKGIKRIKIKETIRKASEPPQSTLTKSELIRLKQTLTPYKLDQFIVKKIDEVDAFQKNVAEYMKVEAVFKAGSVILHKNDFSPLTLLLDTFLHHISIGLYEGLPKYDKLESDFITTLEKIKFLKKSAPKRRT